MTRGTQSGAKRVGPASKAKDRFSGRDPKESFRVLCGKFVLGGTGKAEVRRAAGRRENPERVPESVESTYFWSDCQRMKNYFGTIKIFMDQARSCQPRNS